MKIKEVEDLLNLAFSDNPLGSKLDARPLTALNMRPSSGVVLIKLHHALATMGIMRDIAYKMKVDKVGNLITMEIQGSDEKDVALASVISTAITLLISQEIIIDPEK